MVRLGIGELRVPTISPGEAVNFTAARGATGRWVVLLYGLGWTVCLFLAASTARSLYADGALTVLNRLMLPRRFDDFDASRSFASFLLQAPILFGQLLGAETVSTYAALATVGLLILPAAAFLCALYIARFQPILFSASAFAIVVYGFGANFINTEANILFGLVWLCATILGLDGVRPAWRGVVLPILAFALLRIYEGMALVGPVLFVWSLLDVYMSDESLERTGLLIAALLFLVGTVVGLGGILAPRDPANATQFVASAFEYLKNPQVWLLLSAGLVVPVACNPSLGGRRLLVVASASCAALFVVGIVGLDGYYSYRIYYWNRSLLVISLPVIVAALLAVHWFKRPSKALHADRAGYVYLLIPMAAAVTCDLLGSYRWDRYVQAFCGVLERNVDPALGVNELKRTGALTGWDWNHPTLSVLLRSRGSSAMVHNESASSWQPFDPATPISLPYRGLCQAQILRAVRIDPFTIPIRIARGEFPNYVSYVRGLSRPEGWGTWSDGPAVDIRFVRGLPSSFDLELDIAAVSAGNRGAGFTVRVGGQSELFVVGATPSKVMLSFRNVGAVDLIHIDVPNPESPPAVGTARDSRKLGVALTSISVVPR